MGVVLNLQGFGIHVVAFKRVSRHASMCFGFFFMTSCTVFRTFHSHHFHSNIHIRNIYPVLFFFISNFKHNGNGKSNE